MHFTWFDGGSTPGRSGMHSVATTGCIYRLLKKLRRMSSRPMYAHSVATVSGTVALRLQHAVMSAHSLDGQRDSYMRVLYFGK